MATFFSFTLLSLLFLSSLLLTSSLSDPEILLTFKSSIKDTSNSLISWSNNSLTHHCNWVGINCSTISPFSITSLNLQSLNLSGDINPVICKLPQLSSLNLANNLFNQPIQLQFHECESLVSLNLSSNLIWGTIPFQISQFKALKFLDFSRNKIVGKIPSSIGLLNELQVLIFRSNLLTGSIPKVFKNFTQLQVLDLSENPLLVGEIPTDIGKLDKLEQVFLHGCGFFGVFPDTFQGLVNLKELDLSHNNLSGELPKNLGVSYGKLVSFDVSANKLNGSFPNGICSVKTLANLSLHTNYFTGSLPMSINQCINLERIQLQNNGFSGKFPDKLWSLPNITVIRAENNKFSGEINGNISMAIQLEQVQIDNNSFTGKIPQGLGLVKTLYKFSATNNNLFGDLPPNFCDSPVMSIVNLSHNSLTGKIPVVTKCRKLVSLSLASNKFVGEIPHSLGELPVLTYIDLSDNMLTGSIPIGLQNLKLALFNVSFNQLSGRVPSPLISGLPASYLEGNPDLCGPGLAKSCLDKGKQHQRISLTKQGFALIFIGVAVTILLIVFGFVMYRRNTKSKADDWKSVFFYPLRISEQDLVMATNEKTSVGNGGTFGRVHIISLPSGELIAVKKLANCSNQSFKALKGEIKTLAKIRHKNIVKILGFCCSNDSVFVIYECLPKGSLGDIIGKPNFQMQWSLRLKIAIGIAQALAYLHNDYSPLLLHRNLKATNVLLDADFEPKLSDFALDRIVGDSAFHSIVAFQTPPSCYVAPECKYDKNPTEQMDVYSFGVVLLELVTGRRAEPSDSEEGALDIVKWVRRKINIANGDHNVLDPAILNSSHEEMLGALEIGLHCTSVMPEKRPSMVQIVRALQSLGSKSSSRHLQLMSSQAADTLPV